MADRQKKPFILFSYSKLLDNVTCLYWFLFCMQCLTKLRYSIPTLTYCFVKNDPPLACMCAKRPFARSMDVRFNKQAAIFKNSLFLLITHGNVFNYSSSRRNAFE